MVDTASIIVSAISLLGTLISASIAGYVSFHTEERRHRTASETVLAKYRDPLLLAAHDLQSKLYNLVDHRLYTWADEPGPKHDYLFQHTCYVFGAYFAWVHILRMESQFLLGEEESSSETRAPTRTMSRIRNALLDSALMSPFELWTGVQQAIGELMTVRADGGQQYCMGYAAFCVRFSGTSEPDKAFRAWFRAVESGIEVMARSKGMEGAERRARVLQHLLMDLIDVLDPSGQRVDREFMRRCQPTTRGCSCRACEKRKPGEWV